MIDKLKSDRILGYLLAALNYIIDNCFQRVALNCQVSMWTLLSTGASKGSILGPLVFGLCKLLISLSLI